MRSPTVSLSPRRGKRVRVRGEVTKNQKAPLSRGFDPDPENLFYAWNDFPQPHPPDALGFVTENPAPRKSST